MSGGVSKVPLTGLAPVVEFRASSNRYFVCYPSAKLELVMAFQGKLAAREIAANAAAGTPFFDAIPTVPYGTPYPRPWLSYPLDRVVDGYAMGIELIILA